MNYRNTLLAILVLAALLFSLFTISVASSEIFRVSARAAALYEPISASFIYEKNADERLPMASTTKIMTALVAIEQGDFDTVVTVDERAFGTEGSSAYLSIGDTYTLKDMLYALMLQSANDAAVAIACSVSGTVENFVSLMNEKAEALGLQHTHFSNPNGLDADEHYTTARELAIIAAAALENEAFRAICSTYKQKIHSVFGEKTRLFVNHNKLLKKYEGAIGVKTGYTKKCGRCLVGAAEKDGITLISVTLDAPDDWSDHKKMLDFGFGTLCYRTLAIDGEYSFEIPTIFADKEFATAKSVGDAKVILPKNASVSKEIILPSYLTAQHSKGDVIGKIIFRNAGEIVAELDVALCDNVAQAKKRGFFQRIFGKD